MTAETIDITAVSKLKHADLWKAAQKLGSVKALALACDVSSCSMYNWINLNSCPSRPHHPELPAVLLEITGKTFDELFPEALRQATIFLRSSKVSEQTTTIETGRLLGYAKKTRERFLSYQPSQDRIESRIDNEEEATDLLSILSEKSRKVVELRHGFDEKGERTFREINEELGLELSVNRIVQIYHRAIRDMQDRAAVLAKKGPNWHRCEHCQQPFRTIALAHNHEADCKFKGD